MGDFDKIGTSTTDLLSIHYTKFLSERETKDCKAMLLKRENGPVQSIHVSFYSVACQEVKQDE
jgi:hypothetical protein